VSETTTTNTQTSTDANAATAAAASAATAATATQAAATDAAPATKAETTNDQTAAMRNALLRAQVAQVLGPVQAPWVLDAAIAAAKPDLLSDFTGLTSPSRERISAWKAENAFAFQAAQAQAAAAQATQQTTQGAQGANVTTQQTTTTEVLPATPGSNTGASAGLTTDQLRRLGQIHVDPKQITQHADWPRVKAFWGVQ
jgi:hypothetical protein